MLLTLLFCATVCSAIPLAQEQGPPPNNGQTPNLSSLLRAESSCMDMDRAQTALGSSYQSAFWPVTNTSPMFRIFDADFRTSGKDRFMKEFMKPWGGFQSWECNTNTAGTCARPDCNDLGEEGKNRPGSAAAYQVMLSFANLGQSMKNIFDSLNHAKLNWAAKQSVLTETFNPSHESANNMDALKQALNAISSLIGVAAGLSENPVAAGAAAGIGGVVAGVNMALGATATANKNDVARVADIAKTMGKYFDAATGTISEQLDDFVLKGEINSTESVKLVDLFDEGAFADFSKLPLVDSTKLSTPDLHTLADKVMYAITINTAWKEQRTWIMRYPMTQEEFDTKMTKAGDWDHRLRYWKDGYGHYLQSVWPQQEGPYRIPTYQNPPGWAAVADEYHIPQWHIFESSINSYQKAGFRGDISVDWTQHLDNGATKESVRKVLADITSYDGMFRIPICDLNMNNSGLKTVDMFLDALIAPGKHADCDDDGEDCMERSFSSFCYCLPLTAKNRSPAPEEETKFRDVIDVGGWEGGSNSFCKDW